MRKYNALQKVLALTLTIVMVFGMLPTFVTAVGADAVVRSADGETLNKWRDLLISDTAGVALSTENAGGVWTDKSVFNANNIPAELTNAKSVENTSVSITDTGDNFLVALSAMASNKEIVGYSTIPTDTVFILDMSSSMRSNDDAGQSAIDELVEATNKAITDLQELNKNNRIAVVLYAGNTNESFSVANGTTQVILPLDTYTPGAVVGGVGQFLEAYNGSGWGQTNWNMRVRSGVKNAAGTTVTGSKNSATGTFMQDGIYEAMRVLLNTSSTVVEDGVQAGTTRMPIMVLMTDGEPTMANNDYNGADDRSDLGQSVMHDFDRGNHRDTIAFMTQLTAAFAKKQVEAKYNTDALFYTLAYGEEVTRLDEARSVMDPEQTSTTLNGFWSSFLADQNVLVYTSGYGGGATQLHVKNSTVPEERLVAADKFYVDEYFPAETDDELYDAFEAIVKEIIIQSKYYPTYVEDDHDHDGYLTFADKLGGYMEVTDVKGFVIGDHYFSGATLSAGFVDNSNYFGTISNPKTVGEELVRSIRERLGLNDMVGIDPQGTARQLLQNAYDYGQLSYTSPTNFSNYIGWYSDGAGNYIDFWYEGADPSTAPAGAKYMVKSYLFLGETDLAHGVSNTDMLYTCVRVSKEVNDADADGIAGETIVSVQIPASLIPTLTYKVNVDVDGSGAITGVNSVELENDQVTPIRLLYEIALQEDIHEWNIAEKVNPGYVSSTANKDAGYVFYTNQWNKTDPTLTTRNTYSHFEPSVQNERYYFVEDTLIYSNDSGTVYSGASAPSGSGYYRQNKVYEKMTTGTYRIHIHYEHIDASVLSDPSNLTQDGANWYVKKGVAHRYYHDYELTKGTNTTNTLNHYFYPMVENNGTHYYSHVTLGNNGKLAVTPATGIKVTKTLAQEEPGASNTFNFTISGGTGNATLIRLDEHGDEASRTTLTFNAGGEAAFTLDGGETVYIIGLSDGVLYTISEAAHADYTLDHILVDGTPVVGTTAQITAVDQSIHSAEFINDIKREGGLYITKEMASATSYPDTAFDLTVTLVGNENNNIEIHSDDGSGHDVVLTGWTLTGGVITGLSIKPGHTIYISGLTAGTVATVVESTPSGGFALDGYTSINYSGDTVTPDGEVTIYGDRNATVVVKNTYTASPVDITVKFAGKKNFDATNMTVDSTFTFKLQKYNGATWEDVTGMTDSVTITAGTANAVENFTFPDLVLNDLPLGTTSYQIVEVKGTNADITYDPSVYTFSVVVSDAGDGTLQAQVVGYDTNSNFSVSNTSGWQVDTTFTNHYHTAATYVDIVKSVTDNAGSGKDAAGFVMEAYSAAVDPITGLVQEVGGVWSATGTPLFHTVTDALGEARMVREFTATDFATYDTDSDGKIKFYIIAKEQNTGVTGWKYDNTQYQVEVDVEKDAFGVITVPSFVVEQVKFDENGVATVTPVTTSGATAKITFANTFDPEDATITDLNILPIVKKELTGKEMTEGEFKFEIVNESDVVLSTGYSTIVPGKEGWVLFDNALTFSKVGTYHYKIREVAGTNTGITYDSTIYDMVVTVTENAGKLEATYFFEDTTAATVTFRNTYKPADAQLVLEGVKTLTGRHMVNAEFRFNLTEVDATYAPVTGGLTMQAANTPDDDYNGEATFHFDKITYTAADAGKTFYYLIEEVNSGITLLGVTHNTEGVKYVVKATVTDKKDGTMVVDKQILQLKSGAETAATEMRFNNVYVPDPTTANLTSSKSLVGRVLEAGEFTFTLTEKTDNTYATDKTGGVKETVNNALDGTITFSTLHFSTPGDYYYVAEEAAGSKGGVTYDNTKYQIHVNVVDNHQGKLVASTAIIMVIDEGGTTVTLPTEYITFHNNYTVSGQDGIELSGVKKLHVQTGAMTLADDLFTFEILDELSNVVSTTTNKGSVVKFDKLVFDETDCGNTYTYTIKEKASGIAGVTDSDEVYTLKITVGDDGLGKVVVTYTLTDKGGNPVANTALDFVNTYKVDRIPVTFLGSKTLTGATLAADAYTFDIYPTDSTFAVSGAPAQSETNAADGSFSYTITELDVGTYYYVIKERIPTDKLSTITYDQTPVHVTLKVTDVGGSLKADVSYSKGGVAAEKAVFTNVYTDPAPVNAKIYLQKNVINKTESDIGLDGFTFQLENGEQKITVKSDKNGKAGFQVTFGVEHVGKTFELKISEVKGKTAGMTYDTTVHTVKVKVLQNADGSLALTINDKAADEISLSFTNTYEKPATPVTGDNFPIFLVGAVLLLSAAAIVVLLIKGKKKSGRYTK